jgi:hypothetical protein
VSAEINAEAALERERLLLVIATVVINIVAVSLLAFAPWSDWRTGPLLILSIIACSSVLRSLGGTHCSRDFWFLH